MFRVFSCLTGAHDWRLVVLAGAICFLASLAAVCLFHRARATRGGIRAGWIATAGTTAGSGIWAAHFIAMLAYDPGIATGYDISLTMLSLAVAVVITSCGLSLALSGKPAWSAPAGGAILGVGAACMHYVGMHALEVPGHATWSIDLVLASIALGVIFGTAALTLTASRDDLRATLAAATLLSLAILSHHFTAMGAVEFIPDPTLVIAASALPPTMLAMVIAGVISAMLGVVLVGATMDQFLAERHLQLHTALNNIPQGLLMFDAANRLVLRNERYVEMYGLSPDAVKPGCTLQELLRQRIAVGTFDGVPDQYAAKLIADEPIKSKLMGLPDGRTILVRNQPMANGGWVSMHEDITEATRREASFRLLFESNPLPMWVCERETLRFLDVNAAAVEHYGYSREQFLGMTLLDIRPPEDWDEVRASAGPEDNANGRIRRHIKADSSQILVAIYTRSLNYAGCAAKLVVAIDITARKRAEDELDRTRAFLDTVVENVPSTIIVREACGDRRYVLVNRACEQFFGLSREQVIGKTIHEVLPRPAADLIDERDRELLEQGYQIFDSERIINTVDRGARYVTAQRILLRNEDGKPRYLLTVIDDVTERRRAKEQLVETNETLRAVIDASPVAIIGAACSGIVLTWNLTAERMFGYSAEEAVGRTVADLIVPADQRENFGQFHDRIFSGECFRNMITRRTRKDGCIIDVQFASAPVFAEDGTVRSIVVAMEDITHRKLLEDQLRQSQKMEAIGQLTGGLSHDFNNLLAIIIGNLDLAREELGANPEIAEALDEALNASLRGADLNRRLLAFARRQPLQPRQVDLNELVVGMMKLLSRTLGEHIEIALSTTSDLWSLRVDPTQLESALTNLAVNARDAMPGGGRLTIGTRKASIDQEYAEAHTDVSPGDFVVLEVSDTGTGIPPEMLAHVFEPFFTTKEKEQGTGLGLSMVFGFVKQSGGHIEVYSEVGIGTTLRLYLPRADEAPAEARPTLTAAMPRGHETVLAVEDNEGLRRVLVRQLADLGYRVLEAANAQAAIEILGRDEKIDLLFTDIVLPGGMNGADLARSVVTMRTDMKVLFTSGFPEGAFGPDGALPPGAILLGKPYRKDELARRLRESLAA
jgi:PAS domain S-box-containing protein